MELYFTTYTADWTIHNIVRNIDRVFNKKDIDKLLKMALYDSMTSNIKEVRQHMEKCCYIPESKNGAKRLEYFYHCIQ